MSKNIKLLFNASSNVVGGGVKNSALFISFVINDGSFDCYFALSRQVFEASKKIGVHIDEKKVFIFPISPSKSLGSRRKLRKIEKDLNPDIVYTMAGPAYLDFSSPHIMGLSNAYITHASLPDFFYGKSRLSGCFKFISSIYQSWWSRRSDYYLFQTETALRSFSKSKRISRSRTFLVPNAFDEKRSFDACIDDFGLDGESFSGQEVKVILCPAASYPHKGLWLIPYIAAEIKSRHSLKFKFLVTLDETSNAYLKLMEISRRLGVSELVGTVGSYDYSEISSVYGMADVVFVPSLLETFSATYLEAFSFSKPLVAADKPFAKDVCGDAALYVNPLEFKESADAIASLIDCDELSSRLVALGKERLSLFGTQRDRYETIVSVIRKVAEREYEASSTVDEPRRDAS